MTTFLERQGSAVEVFRIETEYDVDLNSPWDGLWYQGEDYDLNVLAFEARLQPVWKAPVARIENREHRPDIYEFQAFYAVTERVRNILSPLVKDTVEFLPLSIASGERLFVLHPLLRADLDYTRAVVHRNVVGGNIIKVEQYAFPAIQEEVMHMFQLRQAPGSFSRDTGFAYSSVLVSREFKELCEANNVRGAVFPQVFDSHA